MRFKWPFAFWLVSPFVFAGPVETPLIDSDFPDPVVLQAAGGDYYAYATQGAVRGSGDRIQNIQIARSRDLAHWRRLPDALPVKPTWARTTQQFWAPDVKVHEGRYFMYFSAEPDTRTGLCLGVATSARPEGPFTATDAPLACGEGFRNIDPMAYDDPETGKRLLYWGSGFGPIQVRELTRDRLRFRADVPAVPLVAPIPGSGYQNLIEGAWLLRHAGVYYLFYSGDSCCEPKPHYAVMVSRAKHAFGPFTPVGRIILESDARWLAPGHNSVLRDHAGQAWIFYHAIDRERSARGRSRSRSGAPVQRVMLRQRLSFREGWPVVGELK